MKKTLILILTALLCRQASAQSISMKAWEPLLNKKELADYFKGTFERLGVFVDSTRESFTVIHAGDHFTLENGVDSSKTDYFIRLTPQNIRNMQKHGADNIIDEGESYHILAVLFTPLTESGLKHPYMTKPALLKASGVEYHLHIYLDGPGNNEFTAHTMLFVNKQWILVPGIYGKAQRIFHMKPADALEYQRQLFKAQKTDTAKGWKAFSDWYKKWKDTVSVKG